VHEDGSRAPSPTRVGLAAVARSYHTRYGIPLYLSETNRDDQHAVEWLAEQWSEVLLLRTTGVPVYGFTWYGVTDSVDWQHLLREDRGDTDPIGLIALDRSVRRVGTAYGELIARWRVATASGSESRSLSA
jgi:beta-glucosidase/6-phospho-beta-glucosidase/beta-galactosidase